MQLDDYFDFVSPDEIRLRGTRVAIETVLNDYLNGELPEEIALNYSSLSLEQVHATITYYWRNRDQLDAYLTRWRSRGALALESQRKNPSALLQKLLKARSAPTSP